MKRALVGVLALAAACSAERFPGVDRIDFVQVLAWVEPRHGPCWSELSPVHRTPVGMRYSLRSWNPIAGTEHAEGLEELVARGWTRIYRAPQGEGVERRASFTALDLSYSPELRCRCAGVGEAVEESKSNLSLRFRWDHGRMLETSATAGERRTGLSPAITAGHLVTYDFATKGAFPGGKAGSCGAHLALTLLIEPPIL
ncbi:MAG: hypothetical protein E6J70_17830 [Deltaproteobacteria bacterium]|nr:MAG: hypothetical protein E6J70_17830 [Deltaproteobacteria bacterium]